MASIIRPLLWSGLFATTLVIPDPIPFVDEIGLAVGAMNSWDNYFDEKKIKRQRRQLAQYDRQFGSFPEFKKFFRENQDILLIVAVIFVAWTRGLL